MGYSMEIYSAAKKSMENRRLLAEQELDVRRDELAAPAQAQFRRATCLTGNVQPLRRSSRAAGDVPNSHLDRSLGTQIRPVCRDEELSARHVVQSDAPVVPSD